MSDHCPACQIAEELTKHRDATYPEWGKSRAALNFARIIAARSCPDYQPATTEGAQMTCPSDDRCAGTYCPSCHCCEHKAGPGPTPHVDCRDPWCICARSASVGNR